MGRYTYDVCCERGGGGWPISDERRGGCKDLVLTRGREGVQNPKKFVDVLYEWFLSADVIDGGSPSLRLLLPCDLVFCCCRGFGGGGRGGSGTCSSSSLLGSSTIFGSSIHSVWLIWVRSLCLKLFQDPLIGYKCNFVPTWYNGLPLLLLLPLLVYSSSSCSTPILPSLPHISRIQDFCVARKFVPFPFHSAAAAARVINKSLWRTAKSRDACVL